MNIWLALARGVLYWPWVLFRCVAALAGAVVNSEQSSPRRSHAGGFLLLVIGKPVIQRQRRPTNGTQEAVPSHFRCDPISLGVLLVCGAASCLVLLERARGQHAVESIANLVSRRSPGGTRHFLEGFAVPFVQFNHPIRHLVAPIEFEVGLFDSRLPLGKIKPPSLGTPKVRPI